MEERAGEEGEPVVAAVPTSSAQVYHPRLRGFAALSAVSDLASDDVAEVGFAATDRGAPVDTVVGPPASGDEVSVYVVGRVAVGEGVSAV